MKPGLVVWGLGQSVQSSAGKRRQFTLRGVGEGSMGTIQVHVYTTQNNYVYVSGQFLFEKKSHQKAKFNLLYLFLGYTLRKSTISHGLTQCKDMPLNFLLCFVHHFQLFLFDTLTEPFISEK